jgi:photosystem II stability/assembly factor-like uncharacterized protein
MKNLKKIIVFFFFLSSPIWAQEGWTWQNIGSYDYLYSVYFTNLNTGWAVGSDIIYKTTDSGETWFQVYNESVGYLWSVYFINENIGWVVGDTMLKTTNGGSTWQGQTIGESFSFASLSIQFANASVGWLVNLDTILKTTDGGATWQEQYEHPAILESICCIDANLCWVVGSDGTILHTTDGGSNWQQQISGTTKWLESVHFFNDNIGCAVGHNGIILNTSDGGAIWQLQSSGTSNWLGSVCFGNESNCWAVGTSGIILHSDDGGNSWIVQSSGINNDLVSVCFVDQLNGWAIGEYGIVVKTTNGGVSFIDEEEIGGIPNDYSLSQNYPNPFNPSTIIKYSVPNVSWVTIKVYDTIGNEIETLINEEKASGTYKLTWYAESLPAGVYFYSFQAGAFVEAKKMVLLK